MRQLRHTVARLTAGSSVRTVLFLLSASFLFGSSFVAIEIGVRDIPPVLFAAFRFVVGGGLFVVVIATRRDRWYPATRRDLLGVGAVGALIIGLQNAALNAGLQFVPSPAAAVVFGLIPLATTGFAALLIPDESPSRTDVFGILVGFLGVGIVVRPTPRALVSGELVGYTLIVVAVVGISLGSVLLQRADPHLGLLPVSAWGMLVGGLVSFGGAFAVGETIGAVRLSPPAILSLVYLSTLVAVVGYTLYFHLIVTIGSHKANLLSYLDPVMASLVSWVLIGQTIDPLTAVGFCVIFAGFAVIERRMLQSGVTSVLG